jgi:PPOX class probable F420-dependent enzyme
MNLLLASVRRASATRSAMAPVCPWRRESRIPGTDAPRVRDQAFERLAPMTSWTPGWDAFPPALNGFWSERHLCTLTTVRADGRPHAVPVGVALDLEERCAWVITHGASQKARHVAAAGAAGTPVAACQVDGARWSTLEGRAWVLSEPADVRRAEACYADRYRVPRPNPLRVALRIGVDRFLMSTTLAA